MVVATFVALAYASFIVKVFMTALESVSLLSIESRIMRRMVTMSSGLARTSRALVAAAQHSAGPLGRALQLAQKEVVGDRRLKDALGDLTTRERLAELEAFITLLCVSDQEGLELIPSLEAMATSLNEKRAARTIEVAEKGSIKMLARSQCFQNL